MGLFGGFIGKLLGYVLFIAILGVMAAMAIVSVASAGLVSSQVIMADFLGILAIIVAVSLFGVKAGK